MCIRDSRYTGAFIYETQRQHPSNHDYLTREELARTPLPDETTLKLPEFAGIDNKASDKYLASRLKTINDLIRQLDRRMDGAYEIAVNDHCAQINDIQRQRDQAFIEQAVIITERNRRIVVAKAAEEAKAAAAALPEPAPTAAPAPATLTATVPLAQVHCAEKQGVTDSTRTYYAELAAKIKRDPSSYVIDVWAWPQDDCLDSQQHYSLTTDYAMENYLKAMRDVLKWTDIPINICQRTEEPFVTEQDGRKFVGHNGKGLALYEDKRGVRAYVEEGWWQTEAEA